MIEDDRNDDHEQSKEYARWRRIWNLELTATWMVNLNDGLLILILTSSDSKSYAQKHMQKTHTHKHTQKPSGN